MQGDHTSLLVGENHFRSLGQFEVRLFLREGCGIFPSIHGLETAMLLKLRMRESQGSLDKLWINFPLYLFL